MPRAKKRLDARIVLDKKNKEEIVRLEENQEEVREYTRVQKGMVFLYNVDESKDKHDYNKLKSGHIDYTEFGTRPWVVISDNKSTDKLCTIAPMSTQQVGKSDKIKSRVDIVLNGKATTIMCEQMRFVNVTELRAYYTLLSKKTMGRVDRAAMYHLGINVQALISSAVKLAVSNVTNNAENENNNDSSIVNNKHNDNITSIINKTETEQEKGKKYNSKWNREYTDRALQDLKELNERDFTKKYNLKSHQKYLHMRWYAKVRAKQLNINVG